MWRYSRITKGDTLTPTMAAERVLLPPYAEPTHYDLDIVPDMDRFTFSATAKVTVTIVSKTAELQLHAKVEYREPSFTFKFHFLQPSQT